MKTTGKPKSKVQLVNCDCDLAPRTSKSGEHHRGGSSSERGKRSCAMLAALGALICPFRQETSGELSTS